MVYLAIEPEHIKENMSEYFCGIAYLLNTELSPEQIFYHAFFIHLVFVHLHPFSDGNGRAARLPEKWLLSEKPGKEFCNIPSEKYYKENRGDYYNNINIGVNFYELNYDNCLPFLSMLPKSLL